MFNPHNNRTADDVLITAGLFVFTNEMEVGIVQLDDDSGSGLLCCHPNGADHETPAQVYISGGIFTAHEEAMEARLNGCHCGHDHWFTVSTKNGTKSFNGERLATTFEGRKAENEA